MIMNKLVTFIISFLLIVVVLPIQNISVNAIGTGSETDPIIIETEQDIRDFLTQIVGGDTKQGKFYELGNDIAMSSTPLADNTTTAKFEGSLNGKGFEIRNMILGNGTYSYTIKFISNLGTNGVLKNIKFVGLMANAGTTSGGAKGIVENNEGLIENIHLDSTSVISFKNWDVAGFVLSNKATGKIINCSSAAIVTQKSNGAGMIHDNAGLVDGCVFSGILNHEYNANASYAGAIVGTNASSGIVQNCYNTGKITTNMPNATGNFGLIVATNVGAVKNCYNIGTIETKGTGTFATTAGRALIANGGTIDKYTNCYTIMQEGITTIFAGSTSSAIKTQQQMQALSLSTQLGDGVKTAFVFDEMQINNGYPILYWQQIPISPNYGDVEIESIIFNNADMDITASGLTSGNISVDLIIKGSSDKNIVASCVLYKKDLATKTNMFCDMKSQNAIASSQELTSLTIPAITVPDDFENYIIKILIYDSDFKALSPVKAFDKNNKLYTEEYTIPKDTQLGINIPATIPFHIQEPKVSYQTGIVSIDGVIPYGRGEKILLIIKDKDNKIFSISQTYAALNVGYYCFDTKLSGNITGETYYMDVVTSRGKATKSFSLDMNEFDNIALDVKINNVFAATNNPKSNTLIGSYNYFHAIGIKEGDTQLVWIKTDQEKNASDISSWINSQNLSGDLSKIQSNDSFTVLGTNKNYTLNETDAYKKIFFVVATRALGATQFRNCVISDDGIVPGMQPWASNVKIEGNAKEGNTLYSSYTYNHPKYNENLSDYIWLISSDDKNFTEISKGATYTLKKGLAGKYIKFQVIPKTNIEPSIGEIAESESIIILSQPTTGGGGGRVSSKISIEATPIPTATPILEPMPTKIPNDYENHWAKDTIELVKKLNLMLGYDEFNFAPDNNITRAEFIKIIISSIGLELVKYDNSFSDVAKEDWFADYIQTAYEEKIILGNNGLFRPNDFILREEIAKIVIEAYSRLTKKTNNSELVNKFTDKAEMSSWAISYIALADNLGLIKGLPNGNYAPKKLTTRAEGAVILNRLYNLLKGEATK